MTSLLVSIGFFLLLALVSFIMWGIEAGYMAELSGEDRISYEMLHKERLEAIQNAFWISWTNATILGIIEFIYLCSGSP